MVKIVALVDPDKCNPQACGQGICMAIQQCPRKILRQEEPYEIPFVYGNGDLCKGCFLCLAACPLQAIKKI